MARHPVFVEQGQLVEVVFKTVGGTFWLRPSAAVNALILGVLARALQLCRVQLHAMVFMSNHAHLLLTAADAEALARFIGHVKGNIARGVRRLLGRDVQIWSRRTRAIAILDEDAAIERFSYLLRHGVKENLVASPRHWPGVTSARALAGEETLTGTWIDGRAACEDRRRVTKRGPGAYATTLPIVLAPLPCWSDLPPDEYQARCRAMIADIEQEHAASGATPLGAAAVLAMDPSTEPAETKRGPAPPCHASAGDTRAEYLERRGAFVDAYRVQAAALRAGRAATFPSGSFPPRGPFVRFVASSSAAPPGSALLRAAKVAT